jgi:hypothetical protein
MWVGISLENPQTTVGGTPPSSGTYTIVTVNGNSFSTAGTNGTADAEFNPGIQLSLNQMPDVIGKVAWEPSMFDGNVHLEGVGMYREFYDRVGTTGNLNSFENHTSTGGGGGVAGLIKLVPGMLDLQFDTLFGSGIGRYGSGQLSDTTYNANGTLHPMTENMEMLGLTLHATPDLDLYSFAGREAESASVFYSPNSGGLGNPYANVYGCESYTEASSNGKCGALVKEVDQINFGLWDKLYTGDYGSFRFGLQYSYTYLKAFDGQNVSSGAKSYPTAIPASYVGAPHTTDNMIFTSFRYYPF